ncbi:MAG: 7-carboxy-7-deazaguanine synthase QueE [Aggregatilineales bacterium]
MFTHPVQVLDPTTNNGIESAAVRYPVNDCYPAIQGEGAQTGVAMALLRLHGCAVGCPWCDTAETWAFDPLEEHATIEAALGANPRYAYADADTIAAYIHAHCPGPRWLLLTGGEPARYPLRPLVNALHGAGYKVALETSGTELGHIEAGCDWVCVSPKIDMPGGKKVLPEAVAVADEIKHVVGRPRDIEKLDELLEHVALKPNATICLQPVSQNQKATALCIETVIARGWRLSVQMHKYIGQP